jgi:hypothetical protein
MSSTSAGCNVKSDDDVDGTTATKITKRQSNNRVDVLMVGTGEYTTGYVGGQASDSDKGAGVVALTMFDLRRRNKVDRLGMCGVNVRNTNTTEREERSRREVM